MTAEAREARLARWLVWPALATVALVAIVPLLGTLWESLHLHDLRMPWLGRPFVGADHYMEALRDARFRAAIAHTLFFTFASVLLEMTLGLILALVMHRGFRGRGAVRTLVLLPWAVPTIVTGLIWRFMFESRAGIANVTLAATGIVTPDFAWFADAFAAWLPIIAADVWKTTPFVALLLLAGLQTIDAGLYEAARIDGASAWQRFRLITLPMLAPAILVAFVFRSLDAFRVFDLIFVMTGGGPGTATESISLYAFDALLQNLRFGYGSALSISVFVLAFLFAAIFVRAARRSLLEIPS